MSQSNPSEFVNVLVQVPCIDVLPFGIRVILKRLHHAQDREVRAQFGRANGGALSHCKAVFDDLDKAVWAAPYLLVLFRTKIGLSKLTNRIRGEVPSPP